MINNFFNKNLEISKKWLYLAIVSLAIAGFYSILIVALRTPFIKDLIQDKSFFKIALIVHVDSSVLIWFLSCCCIFISSICSKEFNFILKIAYLVSYLGMGLIFISPFIAESEPIINNYVPILHNFFFILGLSLYMSGVVITVLISLFNFSSLSEDLLSRSSYILSLIITISIFAIENTYQKMQTEFNFIANDLHNFYERLFWAGGHLMQFAYSQILIMSWYVLVNKCSIKAHISDKTIFSLMAVNLLFVTIGLYPLNSININDASFVSFYTDHMIYLGGIVPTIIGLSYIFSTINTKISEDRKHIFFALIFSFILFFAGGFIGSLIKGINVTIPAHYHGSIIGITIALIGLIFVLLSDCNFNKNKIKLAKFQVLIYSIGQLIHITGLSISGGYGVMRKDPGSSLSFGAKFNMALMGLGGLMAIIGGILFVYICFHLFIEKSKNEQGKITNS